MPAFVPPKYNPTHFAHPEPLLSPHGLTSHNEIILGPLTHTQMFRQSFQLPSSASWKFSFAGTTTNGRSGRSFRRYVGLAGTISAVKDAIVLIASHEDGCWYLTWDGTIRTNAVSAAPQPITQQMIEAVSQLFVVLLGKNGMMDPYATARWHSGVVVDDIQPSPEDGWPEPLPASPYPPPTTPPPTPLPKPPPSPLPPSLPSKLTVDFGKLPTPEIKQPPAIPLHFDNSLQTSAFPQAPSDSGVKALPKDTKDPPWLTSPAPFGIADINVAGRRTIIRTQMIFDNHDDWTDLRLEATLWPFQDRYILDWKLSRNGMPLLTPDPIKTYQGATPSFSRVYFLIAQLGAPSFRLKKLLLS
ncbi:hypothetical protein [Sclerotinia sclerotiorum alphaflexivirus 2]|uniref:Uncharacterized protein n=1 Tax=Sclerotinia sclerotiorum alphaflexivirus 2 TaxID=3067704 RepID=A0AA49LNB0_9VIRU|nr:hypothetical protein [Sclerotinia sclerotiorum alphaflexivirus 2]